MELTIEQNAELSRLKAYFPYRVVWGAIHPDTQEWFASANTTKRQMNSYVRNGWIVFQAIWTRSNAVPPLHRIRDPGGATTEGR